jgi:hypothetical protein
VQYIWWNRKFRHTQCLTRQVKQLRLYFKELRLTYKAKYLQKQREKFTASGVRKDSDYGCLSPACADGQAYAMALANSDDMKNQ